jgi:hypothetical protein
MNKKNYHFCDLLNVLNFKNVSLYVNFENNIFVTSSGTYLDDLNGSVGSIADLVPKGPGFESQISQGFFLM